MTDLSESFTTQMTEGDEVYPFVEDENANITGYGHQDPATFAAAINRYDADIGEYGEDEQTDWTDSVGHYYVTLDEEDEERLHVCASDAPGAFPVTGLWGQR